MWRIKFYLFAININFIVQKLNKLAQFPPHLHILVFFYYVIFYGK